jgi:glycosyltransferase involved in cell wall biosynthesis
VAARLAGVPAVVHTLHVLPYHQRQPVILQWLLARIEWMCAKLTDEIVSVADTLAEDFAARGVCRREKLHTVVSGIDFAQFPSDPAASRRRIRRELGVGESERVIISVANLEPRKRLDVLIEAAAQLSREGIHARILLTGVGPMEQPLRDQVNDAGLGGDVVFLGRRRDVPDLLAASDVFVQSSELEGLSRSLVEALYSGLCVVATNVNATREVVRDGETGWLVPPRNIQALAGRLRDVLSNLSAARSMGINASGEIRESRSIEAMGQQLDAVYALAVGRSAHESGAHFQMGGLV